MPVCDASVVVEYLLGAERFAQARELLQEHRAGLWAPHLIDAEVGSALRREVASGRFDSRSATDALAELADLPLSRLPHGPLLGGAWALRGHVSFYDGLYVTLARLLDEPLVTCDRRLARTPGLDARIEVLGSA